MGRGVPHPAAAGRAERSGHAAAEPGDSGVPRKRARPRGDEGRQRLDEAARHFDSAIDLDRVDDAGAISISATCGSSRATARARWPSWERLIELSPDRAYLAFDRLERVHAEAGAPAAVRGALPAAHRRRTRATGGRAWRWAGIWPSAASRPGGVSICCSRRSRTTRTG